MKLVRYPIYHDSPYLIIEIFSKVRKNTKQQNNCIRAEHRSVYALT